MLLALPAYIDSLPFHATVHPVSLTGWGRLRWEQVILPRIARQTGAHLLHSLTGSLPLFSPLPGVISPSGAPGTTGRGLGAGLQASVGRGGQSRAQAVLWPEDLPGPAGDLPVLRLPPHAHPAFFTEGIRPNFRLPESYIFCPGPLDSDALNHLAEAWRWASSGLGEDWALVVDGIYPQTAARIQERSGSDAPVQAVERVAVGTRSWLMRHAAVVLLVAEPAPWADPLPQALACERPIAAEETLSNALRAGPAAYLTPPGDSRLLGAAAITLVVEESVAEGLVEAAEKRAEELRAGAFPQRLREAYEQVIRG